MVGMSSLSHITSTDDTEAKTEVDVSMVHHIIFELVFISYR